ncbi:uncharacterized protein LOC107633227 [Arachis ipaensis]|uniref:uncharacterized protein LOC107633227 n=1 Tax=Arachis ipaensis TaxID=130454 RepID=UPI0007AFC306|nr:uncharacterized protein LOC107633227 [Arachis ipaensis]
MAKRIDSLQVASVNVTSQPSTTWGQNEENQEDQQQEQIQYVHNLGSGSSELRSGKILVKDEEATKKPKENDKKQAEKEEASNKEVTASKQTSKKLKEKDDQPQNLRKGKEAIEGLSQGQMQVEKAFTPPFSYPQRFNKETNDQHFPKFLEVFKKLEINSPLAEKGLPPKLEDPGSFFLPCTIGDISINKAMCDLGASINLMPSSLMKRLCIEEVKPIQITLELVDKSVVFPKGVIENLLVKVDKFIFPTDFVILDLDQEEGNSIILGRPFLATARAIIDVEQGALTLRVNDESITLNVFPETHHSDEKKDCMEINKEDLQWKEETNKTLINSLPKQEISNKAGQKENELVQSDEGK